MSTVQKKYDELELRDDFMFSKVMRNQKLCKELLEKILNISIERIEYPEEQKVIDIVSDAKSVRLDVYVNDEAHTIYNIEMQTSENRNLPKRSRYYQGMIDLNLIEKGEDYWKLNKSFVIFICTFDLFHLGRHIYTFRPLCVEDTNVALEDGTTRIFLSAEGTCDDVSEDIKEFLNYLTGKKTDNTWVDSIDQEVKRARRNREWRREYMTLYMRDKENLEKGIQIGIEQGIEKGIERGLEQGIEALINTCILFKASRELTVSRICEEFSVSQEEAEKAVEKHFK